MRRSTDRILTTHAGALHRPEYLLDALAGNDPGSAVVDDALRRAIAEVVEQQGAAGLDVINDGECSKTSWVGYVLERIAGLSPDDRDVITEMGATSKDRADFADFYADAGDQTFFLDRGEVALVADSMAHASVACTGPIEYTGHEQVQRDIELLKASMAQTDTAEGFLAVVAPGSVQPFIRDEFYGDEEAMFAGIAAALKVEYRAIVDAGLICQIDDAFLAYEWDRRLREPGWTLETYRAWANLAVEALNHALEGLPEEQIRYHVCWGSWNGPHSTDIPLADIVDLVLKVNAQAYLLEAANARHEWEYRVWENVRLPEGKILIPGVIEHTTHVIEHPETVADRIIRFANVVGRENVIAGTDCGMRGRSHSHIAWAKLAALSEGAAIASERLWR